LSVIGDRSAGGLRLAERIEDGHLLEVDVLGLDSKDFFGPHARIQHDLRDVPERLTGLSKVACLFVKRDDSHGIK